MEKPVPWWKGLRPLRIPPGCEIVWNHWEDIEPEDLAEDDSAWLGHFTEDILALRIRRARRWHKKTQEQTIFIDLGWYPDGEPKGAYTLQAILNDDWEAPLLEMRTRSSREAADALERWLFQVFMPEQWIEDPAAFRKKWR